MRGTKRHSQSQPGSSRRKFLFLGLAGAAVAAFGVGVAEMPHGDAKTTGAETDDNSPTTLPTTNSNGIMGGPAKSPLWNRTDVYADVLALSGNTLLVQGMTLKSFDKTTGNLSWTAPPDTIGQAYEGTLPATADTVYEISPLGDLIAIKVADGGQSWSVPRPADWTTGGLVGASDDTVVLWSYTDANQAHSGGLWGVDPHSRRLRWTTPVTIGDGAPYFAADAGLILLSQPESHQLTAYDAHTGAHAWTAKDATPNDDTAFATAITSHGTNIYWATNRLYAFDKNGRPLWPVGVTPEGGDGAFHAVIADDDTVYAASKGVFDKDVIVAYKASDGATVWRTSWPKSFHDPNLECQLALGGGNLYIVDHRSGTLVCLDAKTGKTKWQYHDPGASPDVNWSVVADDHYAFIGYNTTVRGFTA
jgi:outer membrane protein assembly factor BamB